MSFQNTHEEQLIHYLVNELQATEEIHGRTYGGIVREVLKGLRRLYYYEDWFEEQWFWKQGPR